MVEKNPESFESSDERGHRFMKLYVGAQRRLFGFVLSLVPSSSDADDIVQKTASIMWSKFDEFEEGTDFAAWALCIARYQILTYRKRKKVKQRRFSDKAMDAIEVISESSFTEEDKLQEYLPHCLEKLKDNERKILYFRYEVGATLRSVAERVDMNINTLYSALNRIHVMLLHCIHRSMAQEEVKP